MTPEAEAKAPDVWAKLPRNLRRVVCMLRAPTQSETFDLVARGLAVAKTDDTLIYTQLGFAVRFHGFQLHQKSRWN